MAMIFPGMDPYLENPSLWTGFHNRLVIYMANTLRPQIRPRYIAAVEGRVYFIGADRDIVPDVHLTRNRPAPAAGTAVAALDAPEIVDEPLEEINQSYIDILDRDSGKQVVTTIEVVSPTNKYAGPGRDAYLAKQREIRRSHTHLVEIDLLRRGPHVLAISEAAARMRFQYDYLVCVNRAFGLRQRHELYPRLLHQPLPRIQIPLADGDPDVGLDLQAVVAQAYDDGDYRERIRYAEPCVPPLTPDQQVWADGLIRAATAAG